MKQLIIALLAVILFLGVVAGLTTTYNPYTSKLDYVGVQNENINLLNKSAGNVSYNVTAAYFFGNGAGITGLATYNATYATWLPNYTLYNKWWYNMSDGSYNVTYDATSQDVAANRTSWHDYSFNSTYDATSQDVTANRTAWLDSCYNSTYVKNTGDTMNGNLIVNGNLTVIGSEIEANVTNQRMNGSLYPAINNIFDIGSPTKLWSNVYTTNLYLGAVLANDLIYNHTLSVEGLYGKWFYNMTSPAQSYADGLAGTNNLHNHSWANLSDYPVACPANTFMTQVDDAITCTSVQATLTSLSVVGNLTVTQGNASVESTNKVCLDGTTCSKYIWYNGTNVVIQG